MSILIVGGNGNMGARYRAILSHLDKDFHVADIGHTDKQIEELAKRCDATIITTPTETHAHFIHMLSPIKKPILCEKPVSMNLQELKGVVHQLRADQTPFSMVYQYRMLIDPLRMGWTHYNYFKHGNDGLAWDCIQVIGLARQQVELEESSPIWRCTINGASMDIGAMDFAYIRFIRNWLKYPHQDLGQLLAIHERTHEMDVEMRKNVTN